MKRHRVFKGRVPWTSAEIETAAGIWQREIVDRYGEADDEVPRGAKTRVYELIARDIGRTRAAVEGRWVFYGSSFAQNLQTAAEHRASASWRLPQSVIADRDARHAAAELRDLTAQFFGDPPPGYSALDRRRS